MLSSIRHCINQKCPAHVRRSDPKGLNKISVLEIVSVRFRTQRVASNTCRAKERLGVMTFMYVNSKSHKKSSRSSFPGQIIITPIFDDVLYETINNCSIPIKINGAINEFSKSSASSVNIFCRGMD